jgi:hypothetical protein
MIFPKEADLCAAFIQTVPKEWIVYPETAGFDMVLVHTTGAQIGIEAKLRLNAKVILQAVDKWNRHFKPGPDFLAVLVPEASELAAVCRLLGLTVLVVGKVPEALVPSGVASYICNRGKDFFSWPELPKVERLDGWLGSVDWYDQAPIDRLTLPDYVPEVKCGVPAPMTLSRWKVQAIRVCIWVERAGTIRREHFRALKIDPGRWMTGHWLKMGAARGDWVAGPQFPAASYRKHHGSTYARIEADFHKWSAEAKLDLPPKDPVQEVLI